MFLNFKRDHGEILHPNGWTKLLEKQSETEEWATGWTMQSSNPGRDKRLLLSPKRSRPAMEHTWPRNQQVTQFLPRSKAVEARY